MPVPPAELTAELTIAPGDDRAVAAGREAAAQTGLALDTGPTTTALSTPRTVKADAMACTTLSGHMADL